MYDSYPEHDVPQQNIIQMFFAQRWSAIVIEMALAIVISVAAGRAFDFFGPIDAQTENPPPPAAADISLDPIKPYEINDIRQGQSAGAAQWLIGICAEYDYCRADMPFSVYQAIATRQYRQSLSALRGQEVRPLPAVRDDFDGIGRRNL